jgi:drug/metabolite transporter (DMT)-like permease
MKGFTIALLSMAFSGLYAIFGKMLVSSAVDPFIIIIISQLLAGLILIGAMDLFRKIREIRETSRHDFKIIAVISVFSSVVAPLLYLVGLAMTSVANTVLIARVDAVLMSIMAVMFLKERTTVHQVTGTIVMFLGVAYTATHGFSAMTALNAGDMLILLSAASFAVGNTLFKKYMRHIPPEVIVTMRNIFGAVILFGLSLLVMEPSAFYTFGSSVTATFVYALIGLVIFVKIAGQLLWYKALEITTATRVSTAVLLSPVIGVFYAVVLLGETLVQSQIIGGILIATGLVIVEIHIRSVKSPLRHKFHLRLKHHRH